MKVTSKQEAWNKVNEIFPTDYEQDLGSSDRAGYPIYRSTAEGHYYDYICDLGNRLEVNLDSSHLATVNIWIEEPAKVEDNIQEGVEAMHAAKALGQTIYPIYDPEQYTLITLCVDGDRYGADDTMCKVYDGLKRGENWLAGDLIASYCESHGIRWRSIQDTYVHHNDHGEGGTAATSWSRATLASGSPNRALDATSSIQYEKR